MIISAVVSWYYDDGALKGILFAGILAISIGSLLQFATKGFEKVGELWRSGAFKYIPQWCGRVCLVW